MRQFYQIFIDISDRAMEVNYILLSAKHFVLSFEWLTAWDPCSVSVCRSFPATSSHRSLSSGEHGER